MSQIMHRQRTGLRPVGSRRTYTFDMGEAKAAATTAQAGDSVTDDLISNMTDVGLDRFASALNARGLDFGMISESGPTEHEPLAWLIYPTDNPEAVL